MRFDLLVNTFVYWAVQFRVLALFRPTDRRTLLHVSDAAKSFLLALENYERIGGEAFNAGDPSLNCTKQQIVDTVTRHFPATVIVQPGGEDPDKRDYPVQYEKIRHRLGFAAEIALEEGIREVGAVAELCPVNTNWRFAP
jgi:nucleoside-diphosphate-sugar epimerase